MRTGTGESAIKGAERPTAGTLLLSSLPVRLELDSSYHVVRVEFEARSTKYEVCTSSRLNSFPREDSNRPRSPGLIPGRELIGKSRAVLFVCVWYMCCVSFTFYCCAVHVRFMSRSEHCQIVTWTPHEPHTFVCFMLPFFFLWHGVYFAHVLWAMVLRSEKSFTFMCVRMYVTAVSSFFLWILKLPKCDIWHSQKLNMWMYVCLYGLLPNFWGVLCLFIYGMVCTFVYVLCGRVHDKRTGTGKSVIKGAETFSGGWKDGEYHGRGVHCDARGNVYDGEVTCSLHTVWWCTLHTHGGRRTKTAFRDKTRLLYLYETLCIWGIISCVQTVHTVLLRSALLYTLFFAFMCAQAYTFLVMFVYSCVHWIMHVFMFHTSVHEATHPPICICVLLVSCSFMHIFINPPFYQITQALIYSAFHRCMHQAVCLCFHSFRIVSRTAIQPSPNLSFTHSFIQFFAHLFISPWLCHSFMIPSSFLFTPYFTSILHQFLIPYNMFVYLRKSGAHSSICLFTPCRPLIILSSFISPPPCGNHDVPSSTFLIISFFHFFQYVPYSWIHDLHIVFSFISQAKSSSLRSFLHALSNLLWTYFLLPWCRSIVFSPISPPSFTVHLFKSLIILSPIGPIILLSFIIFSFCVHLIIARYSLFNYSLFNCTMLIHLFPSFFVHSFTFRS